VNPSAITLLKSVRNGITDSKELMKIVNVKEWQLNNLVKDLSSQGYIEKIGSTITFKSNSKTILFRDVAGKFDVEKLLHDSNELVFTNVIEPRTIEEIQHSSKISLRTIQRAISELESIGAVRRNNEGKFSINRENSEQLYLFAKYLKTEAERRNVEPYAEIIYQDAFRTLKKVPKGKRAEGELTGFSMFTEYGIEYHTTHDYYIQQETPLKLEDVLVHAIVAAAREQDKLGLAMAMIFYLKNKHRMDPLSIRPVARQYKVSDIWVDMEGYLRNTELKNPKIFLPWEEFEEKAKLYEISSELYTFPVAYPDLFKDVGQKVEPGTEAFLFGGENMRLKGLKPRTKDCDVVLSDAKSYISFVTALKEIGYASMTKEELSPDDLRIDASDILKHNKRSRVDIFRNSIARKLVLSERMKKRAKIEQYGYLKLGLIANEDVFLLKSVTLREGDIQDMARLARSAGFDWKIVFDEMEKQERETSLNFSENLLLSLDDLYEQTGIRPPFYNRLVRHVLDYKINKQIRDNEKSLNEVVSALKGADITEKMIRNRIDYLVKTKSLRKVKRGDQVILQP